MAAQRYDESNAPSYADEATALNFQPYFEGGGQGIDAQYGPSSMHPGGVMHLLGDGSVRMVVDGIDATAYDALVTRAGAEAIAAAASD